MNNDCIFCKIILGQLPSAKVYEDKEHIAILDLFPVAAGHMLLLPKRHYVNIFDATKADCEGVYAKLSYLAKALQLATGCKGLNIIQNNGEDAGQVVFHSHIHLIPRYGVENLPLAAQGKHKATAEELATMADKIKAALL